MIVIKGINPELAILGPLQQFNFDLNLSAFQLNNLFVPTSIVSSKTNFETRNNTLSGFRWIQTTNMGDTFGTLVLQSFVYGEPTGTDILTFNQDGSIVIDETVSITLPPLINVQGNTQTFSYAGASQAAFILANTFAASGGNPSFTDLELLNSTTGGWRFRNVSAVGDLEGIGELELQLIPSSGSPITNVLTVTPLGLGLGQNVQINATNFSLTTSGTVLNVTDNYAEITRDMVIDQSLVFVGPATSGYDQTISIRPNAGFGTTLAFQIPSSSENFGWYQGTSPTTSFQMMTLTGGSSGLDANLTLYSDTTPNFGLTFYRTDIAVTIASIKTVSVFATDMFVIETFSDVGAFNLQSANHMNITAGSTIAIRCGNLDITGDTVFGNNVSINGNTSFPGGITLPALINITSPTETFSYSGNNEIGLILLNTTIPTSGNPTFNDLEFQNNTTGGFRWQYERDVSSSPSINTMVLQFIGDSRIGTTPLMSCSYQNTLPVSSYISFSTNIGIGVIPTSPLHFSNSLVASDMITLYSEASNSFQCIAIGVNPHSGYQNLNFQIGQSADSFEWYVGTSSSSSSQLMQLTGAGTLIVNNNISCVGTITVDSGLAIGNILPHYPIHFANITGPNLVLWAEVTPNNYQYTGLGLDSDQSLVYSIPTNTSSYKWNTGTSTSTSARLMTLDGSGNLTTTGNITSSGTLVVDGISSCIGNLNIGGGGANSPLQFANSVTNRILTLYENANNLHQFHGFGINSNVLRYQIPDTTQANVWYAATSSTTSNELMRLDGTGNLTVQGNLTVEGLLYSPQPFINASFSSSTLTFTSSGRDLNSNGLYTSNASNQFSISGTHFVYNGTPPLSNVIVNVNVFLTFANLLDQVTVTVYKNGSYLGYGGTFIQYISNTNINTFTLAGSLSLNTGDYISLEIYSFNGNTVSIGGGSVSIIGF